MNLLIFHLHDMGRYCSPYGHAMPTPNMERLAAGGTVFRQAHCCSPTCSPSRAALLTGETAHQSELTGLLHRGFQLKDQTRHLAYVLGQNGYETAYAGVQHEFTEQAGPLPYQKRLCPEHDTNHKTRDRYATDMAVEYLDNRSGNKPFFLWVGMFLPHRPFIHADESAFEIGQVRAPDPLPDTPEIRSEMRDYAASVALADNCLGDILGALEANQLAEDTIVILTTDHGIDFPKMKCTLNDAGTGVALITRIPGQPESPKPCDALVSHLDVFPTLCDLLDVPAPDWLQGKSMRPLLEGQSQQLHTHLFAELNFHASYEPARSVRTERYKLIKVFDTPQTIMPNIGNGATKQYLMERGLSHSRMQDSVQLYDLVWDPTESNNLADSPEHLSIRNELEQALENWMQSTHDPLLQGPLKAPAAARLNRRDGLHPEDNDFIEA